MNWRESLPVMEFHHPPNFPRILAAIPGSQNCQNTTGHPVLSWFLFYLVLDFCWLGFRQVSLLFSKFPRSISAGSIFAVILR